MRNLEKIVFEAVEINMKLGLFVTTVHFNSVICSIQQHFHQQEHTQIVPCSACTVFVTECRFTEVNSGRSCIKLQNKVKITIKVFQFLKVQLLLVLGPQPASSVSLPIRNTAVNFYSIASWPAFFGEILQIIATICLANCM